MSCTTHMYVHSKITVQISLTSYNSIHFQIKLLFCAVCQDLEIFLKNVIAKGVLKDFFNFNKWNFRT